MYNITIENIKITTNTTIEDLEGIKGFSKTVIDNKLIVVSFLPETVKFQGLDYFVDFYFKNEKISKIDLRPKIEGLNEIVYSNDYEEYLNNKDKYIEKIYAYNLDLLIKCFGEPKRNYGVDKCISYFDNNFLIVNRIQKDKKGHFDRCIFEIKNLYADNFFYE